MMESDVAVVEEIPKTENVDVVDEMAEDATSLMTSSTTSGQTGSDNDSWTIIDGVEEEEVSLDATKDTASFAKPGAAEVTKDEGHSKGDTDGSDIETLSTCPVEAGEENLDSFLSDGLPVTEDMDAVNASWIWEPDEVSTQDSEKPDDLSSVANELPVEFPSIQKGHTYSHVPNVKLNVLLTSALVLGVFMTIGLGVGHFKGWSEKLELQEQWSEQREGKLEELTESLVSCITQDGQKSLEDEVIHQLNQENNDLKLALSQKESCGARIPVAEGNVLLKQRINELLIENADLEKEVARLRYSHSAMVDVESTKQDLLNIKRNLNEIANENDQLKMEVGKARYGKPLNNDLTNATDLHQGDDNEVVVDEEPEPEKEVTEEDTAKCKSILKSKFQKSFDTFKDSIRNIISGGSGAGLGLEISKLSEAFNSKMEQILQSVPEKVAPAGKKLVKVASKIAQKLHMSLDKGVQKASDFLEKSLGEDPAAWQARHMHKFEEAMSVILNDWTGGEEETGAEEPKKDREHLKDGKVEESKGEDNKEGETIRKEERKEKSYIKKDEKLESREIQHGRVETKKERKRREKELKKKEKEERKRNKAIEDKDRKNKWEGNKRNNKKKDKERNKQNKPTLTKTSNLTSTDWMSGRAHVRENQRHQEKRSDWLFDRARDREKFHKLTGSEWYEKNLHRKDCQLKEKDGHVVCEDLEERNPGARNHGASAKKNWNRKEEKEQWKKKKKEWIKNRFYDYNKDDDDDDDDDDNDDEDDYEYQERRTQRKYDGSKYKQDKRHGKKKREGWIEEKYYDDDEDDEDDDREYKTHKKYDTSKFKRDKRHWKKKGEERIRNEKDVIWGVNQDYKMYEVYDSFF